MKVRLNGASRAGVILVSQVAVQQGPQGSYVYVIGKENTIEARDITATSWEGNQWAVEQGLQEGEQVVVSGVQKIGPGVQVCVISSTVSDGQVSDAIQAKPEAAE